MDTGRYGSLHLYVTLNIYSPHIKSDKLYTEPGIEQTKNLCVIKHAQKGYENRGYLQPRRV